MPYRLFADVVVILHFGFVLFVVFGGLAIAKWTRLTWLHLPAVLWAAVVEFAGWICPLTPLETSLRIAAGADAYETGFVEHYLLPLLYPGTLTRSLQIVLGATVLAINIPIYSIAWTRWARVSRDSESR